MALNEAPSNENIYKSALQYIKKHTHTEVTSPSIRAFSSFSSYKNC